METSASSPAPPRPRVWTVFAAFVAALVLNLLSAPFGIFVISAGWIYTNAGIAPTEDEILGAAGLVVGRPLVMTTWISASCVALLGFLALLAWLSPSPPSSRFAVGTSWPSQRVVLVGALGTLAVGYVLNAARNLVGQRAETLDLLTVAARTSSPVEFLALLVPIVVLAPLVEELLFRGYAQTRLVERWGAGAGIGVTSVAFGLFHVNLVHAAVTAGAGAMLGYLRHRTGDVRASIVAHGANNLAVMLLVRQGPAEAPGWGLAAGAAIALLAATGTIAWLRATPTLRPG